MILNKFRQFSLHSFLKSISLQFLALSLFSCSKTANSNENKAFIALTHVAYGVGPINIVLDGDSLLSVPLPFGSTSGSPSFPYDTTVSRVSDMELVQGNQVILRGNSAFQQGSFYSVFVYDTLNIDTAALGMIILQNNPPLVSDTNCSFRFLNFSPGSKKGLVLVYKHDTTIYYVHDTSTDTVNIVVRDTNDTGLSSFVGENPIPSAYTFINRAHTGVNQVFVYVDSANPRPDSSNYRRMSDMMFTSPKSYNIYFQDYFSPGPLQDSLKVVSFPVN
jgi:hypothetical protein